MLSRSASANRARALSPSNRSTARRATRAPSRAGHVVRPRLAFGVTRETQLRARRAQRRCESAQRARVNACTDAARRRTRRAQSAPLAARSRERAPAHAGGRAASAAAHGAPSRTVREERARRSRCARPSRSLDATNERAASPPLRAYRHDGSNERRSAQRTHTPHFEPPNEKQDVPSKAHSLGISLECRSRPRIFHLSGNSFPAKKAGK